MSFAQRIGYAWAVAQAPYKPALMKRFHISSEEFNFAIEQWSKP